MMWIAIIICFAIGDNIDAGIVLFLHAFNSTLGFYETMEAGDAVAALKKALAPRCNVKRDGQWTNIEAKYLVPGDLIILKIGDETFDHKLPLAQYETRPLQSPACMPMCAL